MARYRHAVRVKSSLCVVCTITAEEQSDTDMTDDEISAFPSGQECFFCNAREGTEASTKTAAVTCTLPFFFKKKKIRLAYRFGRVRPSCDRRPGLVQVQCAHEAFRGSDVHVIVLLLVRLALQRRLLARRLLHLQRRLAQSVLLHRGCGLR